MYILLMSTSPLFKKRRRLSPRQASLGDAEAMRFVQGAKKRKPSRVIGFIGPCVQLVSTALPYAFYKGSPGILLLQVSDVCRHI